MTSADIPSEVWVQRAVDRSAAVQRSRLRIAQQVRQMVDAARKLIEIKGDEFTTQELAVEAGVALQTFYRYFTSKDELLVTVIGDAMADACEQWAQTAAGLPDPLARLRYYIVDALQRIDDHAGTSRFIAGTRWRLHRQYPKELAEVERPFIELLRDELDAAVAAGLLNPPDVQWDSWFIAELTRAVFHFYAFAPHPADEFELAKERLWQFCLAALGGPIAKDVEG